MTQVSESDYRTAQQGGARVRQDFVDAVNFGNESGLQKIIRVCPSKNRVVSDVRYQQIQTNLMMNMSTYIFPQQDFALGGQILEIFPWAFTDCFTNFMSSMLHHELHHARQYQKKENRIFRAKIALGELVNHKYYEQLLAEIPAFLNQLTVTGEFSVSQFPAYQILFPAMDNLLQNEAKKLGRDWKQDLSRFLCPSPHDDCVRQRYGID